MADDQTPPGQRAGDGEEEMYGRSRPNNSNETSATNAREAAAQASRRLRGAPVITPEQRVKKMRAGKRAGHLRLKGK